MDFRQFQASTKTKSNIHFNNPGIQMLYENGPQILAQLCDLRDSLSAYATKLAVHEFSSVESTLEEARASSLPAPVPPLDAELSTENSSVDVVFTDNSETQLPQVFDICSQGQTLADKVENTRVAVCIGSEDIKGQLFDQFPQKKEIDTLVNLQEDISENSKNRVFNLSSLPSETKLLDIMRPLTPLESAVKVGKSDVGIDLNVRVEGFVGAVPFRIRWFDTGQGSRFPNFFTVKCDSRAFVMFDNQQAMPCLLFAHGNQHILGIDLDRIAGKVSNLEKSVPADVLSVAPEKRHRDGEFALILKQLSLTDFPRSIIVNDYDILFYTPLHKLHLFGNSSYHPNINIHRTIGCIVAHTLILGLSDMIIPISFFWHNNVTTLHPLLFQLDMIGSTLHGCTNDELNLPIELIQLIERAGQITFYVIRKASHQGGGLENEAVFLEVMQWDSELCTVTLFSYARMALVVHRTRNELFFLLEYHELGWCELLDMYSVTTFDCVRDTFVDAMRNTPVLMGTQVVSWDIRDSLIFRLSPGCINTTSIHPYFDEVFAELCVLTDDTKVFDPGAHLFYYVAMRVFEWEYQLQFTGATMDVVDTISRTCAFVLPFEDNEVWGCSWCPFELNGIAKVGQGLFFFLGSFLDLCVIYIECLLRTLAAHLLVNFKIYYNLISRKVDAATCEAWHKFLLVLTAFGLGLEDWQVNEQPYFHSTTGLVVYISFSNSPFDPGIHDILIDGLVQQNRRVHSGKLFTWQQAVSSQIHVELMNVPCSLIQVSGCDYLLPLKFDPGGVNQETKFYLFSDNEDHKVSQVQLNGVCYAQQAVLSGYTTGGLTSIMHCDEFTILLPSSTTVKCLSEVGGWIPLDIPFNYGWIVVDPDNVTPFKSKSYITLRATKIYMCESTLMVQANTIALVLSLEFLVLNLEDKVLIDGGGIVMNYSWAYQGTQTTIGSGRSNWAGRYSHGLLDYSWDPGSNLPSEFAQLVADVKANTPGIENVVISVHCHDDLGLATANTLAGISAGAREADLTINGIGERAGNASLEEVVMAIKCHGEQVLDGLYTGINTQHIIATSKMVEEYSGLSVQRNKAIVGANAFAHGSGIHQDGVLKLKDTYEFISPEDVGLYRANVNGIVLGKLSGRHALKAKMLELGYEVDKKELEDVFRRFKSMDENKKKITDDDLKALVSDELYQPQVVSQLGDVQDDVIEKQS